MSPLCFVASLFLSGSVIQAQITPQQSATNAVQYLADRMDQFHRTFDVYTDVSAPGNHFHYYAKTGNDLSAMSITGSWTSNVRAGATCIRAVFRNTTGLNYGGFYFLNGLLQGTQRAPSPNFGQVANAGYDLRGAVALRFWARGERGGERINFFAAGVGRDPVTGAATENFPDSSPVIKQQVQLTTQWTQYVLLVQNANLSYVLGGFGWDASALDNPAGATFYLDDIQYELNAEKQAQRLNEPRLITSFSTRALQVLPPATDSFDLLFRNAAYSYDNALAMLAFLAVNTTDGLRRARLLGDALVYAAAHDRAYTDGRVRDAYASGDLRLPPGWTPNGRAGTVPVSGHYVDFLEQFNEIEQGGVSTGNNAWSMVALLALYQRTLDASYLSAARMIGNFIRGFRVDSGTYRGFQGGLDNPEGQPVRRQWQSVEHNLDIYAAFTAMYRITGEQSWQTDAAQAAQFVEAMWDGNRNCYLAGTGDPSTRNTTPGQLPLDTQSWAALAIPGIFVQRPQLLTCAETNHATVQDGFSGFDFNEDRDGVWFEGTAQMADAYAWSNQQIPAGTYRGTTRVAQATDPYGDGFGVAAAVRTGTSSGFGFQLFQRLHVGATAWHVFSQLAFNPYYQAVANPDCANAVLPRRISFAPSAATASLSVLAATGCTWSASTGTTWITLSSASTTSGQGTVTFQVAANPATAARTGTIDVAGRTVTVMQGAAFRDVEQSNAFFQEIGKLSALGVTTGCGEGRYCPDDNVTREQMAAFLVRALGEFAPSQAVAQRFGDVPPANGFYGFIDQLAARQITLGCGGGNYCPGQTVSREQMAAFLIRALKLFDPLTAVSQKFNDVPATNAFYGFIDQLGLRQITQGCFPGLYCPGTPVTRGQMAAFLVRAFGL